MTLLTDHETNSFLIISGRIDESKRNEFEQTFRLASGTMTSGCILHNLSADTSKERYYHFFSLWTSESALKRFIESAEYQMMSGAFQTLGYIDQAYTGLLSGRKNFL